MDIIKTFYANANPDKAVGMKKYMRNQFEYLGLQKPARATLARDFLNAAKQTGNLDWTVVEQLWDMPEREFQYLAIDYILKLKAQLTLADLPKIKALAQRKSWWDSVDALQPTVTYIVEHNPASQEVMLEWAEDADFWVRRLALTHQLHQKTNTNAKVLAQIILKNLDSDEFFINKAIGWALRDYSKTNPDWVCNFCKVYRKELNPLSMREGLKHVNTLL
ncbi:MAG: DNA alkylation repair protein [Lactobacillaceae bacterium]|jgi:3-methyladenine DNA glycosylase AlkD|nr:DNA alkylation repair protein [Lactobacillaceae bacterium]